MIRNLLTAFGFPLSGCGRYNCTQIENNQLRVYTWGETIHKTTQKHGTHKVESKTYKTIKRT